MRASGPTQAQTNENYDQASGQAAERAANLQRAKEVRASNLGKTCELTWTGGLKSFTGCLQIGVSWIAYFFLFICSWFAGIMGVLLNEAITFAVVNMSSTVNDLPAIKTGWGLVRDIGNLTFIFMLLYVAITTVLGLSSTNTKRLIRNLIIVGLLVNFSLFFTKVIIDASNIVSLTLYDQFAGGAGDVKDFTGKIAGLVGLNGLYGGGDTTNSGTAQQQLLDMDWGSMLATAVGGSIFLVILGLRFLYAAVLFLLRFVILIVMMVLSPIGYFGYILPQTTDYARKWWSTLTAQAAFAPFYMLMILIIFTVAIGISGATGGSGSLSSLASPDISAIQSGTPALSKVINFVVLIALVNIAALLATKVASSSGGAAARFMGGKNFVTGAMNKGLNKTRQAAVGTGRLAVSGAKAGVGAAASGGRGLVSLTGNALGTRLRNTRGKAAYEKLESEEGKEIKRKAELGDKGAIKELKKLQSQASADYNFASLFGMKSAAHTGGYKTRYEESQKKNAAKVEMVGASKTHIHLVDNAKKDLAGAQQDLSNAIASGQSPTLIKELEATVKEKERLVARRQVEAKANMKARRRKAAAKMGTIKGNGPAAAAQRAAARQFIDQARKEKPTDAEKLIEAEVTLRSASNRNEIRETLKKLKNNVKDLPDDILTNPEIAKHLTKENLNSLRSKGEEVNMRKIAETILSDVHNPGFEYLKNQKRDSPLYFRDLQDRAQRLVSDRAAQTTQRRQELADQRSERQRLQEQESDPDAQPSRERERDTSDEL
jgi:hypothetical protein